MKKFRIALAFSVPLVVSYAQVSHAQPQFVTQVTNYCASNGTPVVSPITCSYCHSGTAAPSENNANTILARDYQSGNLAAFCGPSTGPVNTPTPIVTPPPRVTPPPQGHSEGGHHEGSRQQGSRHSGKDD